MCDIGEWLVIGLSCRWLDGAARQQCAGHLPFERQARANGSFPILPTGSTDPMRSLHLEENGHSTLEPRVRASTPVNGEVSPPSAERRKAFELVRFGVAITDDSQKLLILARQKN